MKKTKTIRVSDQVLDLLESCKSSETASMNTVVANLTRLCYCFMEDYTTLSNVLNNNGDFRLNVGGESKNHFCDIGKLPQYCVTVPKFTKVSNIIRVSEGTYKSLLNMLIHPNESLNMELFRISKTVSLIGVEKLEKYQQCISEEETEEEYSEEETEEEYNEEY